MPLDPRPGLYPSGEEDAFLYPSDGPVRASSNLSRYLPEVRGSVCLPMSCSALAPDSSSARPVRGLKHDNRSLILPGFTATIAGRTSYLAVKGVGARIPVYGMGMPGRRSGPAPGSPVMDHWRTRTGGDPVFTGELWFGSSPYGAHGQKESQDSVAITELCGAGPAPNCLKGLWICPVLFSTELPGWVVRSESERYWYRKYRGIWSQHFRLVPGNIRLYFHSDCAMGVEPGKALAVFGVEGAEALDSFIDRFIRSGLAALTLAARTAEPSGGGFRLLDYDDVWLDKDSIIAADGTIHFADIEDLEWRQYDDAEGVRRKVRRQFERNFLEFMFGLDVLLSEAFLLGGTSHSPEQRRLELAARFSSAVVGDSFLGTEMGSDGLDLLVKCPSALDSPEAIRLLDLGPGKGWGK